MTVTASALSGDDQLVTLQSTLSDGSTLTLTASAVGVGDTLAQVRWILAIASVGVLVIAAGAVTIVVRRSLRPLDRVSDVARAIGAGERERRLRPTRPETEIGRVATALDDMLDDVVGAEQTAREAEARLRAFLSDAAHELRTPVAGIRAAADTLVRADLDGPEREVLATQVAREAARASRLVDDLLTMAASTAGSNSNGSTSTFVRSCAPKPNGSPSCIPRCGWTCGSRMPLSPPMSTWTASRRCCRTSSRTPHGRRAAPVR